MCQDRKFLLLPLGNCSTPADLPGKQFLPETQGDWLQADSLNCFFTVGKLSGNLLYALRMQKNHLLGRENILSSIFCWMPQHYWVTRVWKFNEWWIMCLWAPILSAVSVLLLSWCKQQWICADLPKENLALQCFSVPRLNINFCLFTSPCVTSFDCCV